MMTADTDRPDAASSPTPRVWGKLACQWVLAAWVAALFACVGGNGFG